MSHQRPLQFPFGYSTVLFITAASLCHTNRNAPRGPNLPEPEFSSLQIPRFGAPPHSSPIRYQIFGNVYRHKCQRNLLRVWLVVSCIVLTQPPICIFYLHAGNLLRQNRWAYPTKLSILSSVGNGRRALRGPGDGLSRALYRTGRAPSHGRDLFLVLKI